MESEQPEGLPIRERRMRRLLRSIMRSAEGGEQTVLIRNLSRQGVGASASGEVPTVGTAVEFELDTQLWFGGVVRWTDGPAFGVELTQAIDPDTVSSRLIARGIQERPSSEPEERRCEYSDLVYKLTKRIDNRRACHLSVDDLDLLVLSGAFEALVTFAAQHQRDQARERVRAR